PPRAVVLRGREPELVRAAMASSIAGTPARLGHRHASRPDRVAQTRTTLKVSDRSGRPCRTGRSGRYADQPRGTIHHITPGNDQRRLTGAEAVAAAQEDPRWHCHAGSRTALHHAPDHGGGGETTFVGPPRSAQVCSSRST